MVGPFGSLSFDDSDYQKSFLFLPQVPANPEKAIDFFKPYDKYKHKGSFFSESTETGNHYLPPEEGASDLPSGQSGSDKIQIENKHDDWRVGGTPDGTGSTRSVKRGFESPPPVSTVWKLFPTYGNYGGPQWSSGSWGGDPYSPTRPEPISPLDAFYERHDQAYSSANTLEDVRVSDRELVLHIAQELSSGSWITDPLGSAYSVAASSAFFVKELAAELGFNLGTVDPGTGGE